MDLIEASEKLRAFLVENLYAENDYTDVPDDIWIPFCDAIKQAEALKPSHNSAMAEIALPDAGVFILCGIELGMKAHDVSKLYHAVVARLHQ